MVIFNRDGIIVQQHPFLEYYQVEPAFDSIPGYYSY